MAADEPPYLTVGTDVSAKYKGAFCEAKVKKVNRMVKCKVTFKNSLGSSMIPDDQIRGTFRIGAEVEALHPEKKQYLDAIINKMQDYSQYTVVFDDGDETTLRRTSLCLKSGRHFAESPTLDQFPLTHPEHFGTPVIGTSKTKRKRRSTMNSAALEYYSSDEEILPKKKYTRIKEKDADVGKLLCIDYGDRRKKDNWYPGLVVSNTAQVALRINPRDEYLIRSFKDGKYYTVSKKDTREFTRDMSRRIDNNTLRSAVDKAMHYHEKGELPPHWDKAQFGVEVASNEDDSHDTDSDSSDDEPSEEKDRFVAQLYKFMEERGTPINKAPTVGSRDVNLYKLFKVVHKMGGYNRVTNQNKWKIIYSKMGFPPTNPSGANQIKLAYKRYLHSFEDFYRKLGCTMVSNSRSTRGRHRSDRNFIITRNRDRDTSSPKRKKDKEKIVEKKSDDKVKVTNEKKELKAKSENLKSEDKPKSIDKKRTDKLKMEEKDDKFKLRKEENNKPRLIRSHSLNKDKKEREIPDEKKETRNDRAKAREDAKKDKSESPEKKKETRSSVKFEQEREKREKECNDKKPETGGKEHPKKDEKVLKHVKEEKSLPDKREEPPNKSKKTLKEKEDKPKTPSAFSSVKDKKVFKKEKSDEVQSKEKKEETPLREKKEEVPAKEKKSADVVKVEKNEDILVIADKKERQKDIKASRSATELNERVSRDKCLKEEKEKAIAEPGISIDNSCKEKPAKDIVIEKEDTFVRILSEIKPEKNPESEMEREIFVYGSIPSRCVIDDEEYLPGKIMKKRRSTTDEKDAIKPVIDIFDNSDEDLQVISCEKGDKEKKPKGIEVGGENKDRKPKNIEVGDKVKVKYGRGRTQKVYEAKVLKIELENGEKRYYVHYAGWNTRYDEWVKRNFIVENISEHNRAIRRKKQQAANLKGTSSLSLSKKNDRSRLPSSSSASKLQRKNSTSSTNSSTVSNSRTTRSDKSGLYTSPFSIGLQPRKRTRKKSGISLTLTDTSQDSESDGEGSMMMDPDDDEEEDEDIDIEGNPMGKPKEEIFSDDEEIELETFRKLPEKEHEKDDEEEPIAVALKHEDMCEVLEAPKSDEETPQDLDKDASTEETETSTVVAEEETALKMEQPQVEESKICEATNDDNAFPLVTSVVEKVEPIEVPVPVLKKVDEVVIEPPRSISELIEQKYIELVEKQSDAEVVENITESKAADEVKKSLDDKMPPLMTYMGSCNEASTSANTKLKVELCNPIAPQNNPNASDDKDLKDNLKNLISDSLFPDNKNQTIMPSAKVGLKKEPVFTSAASKRSYFPMFHFNSNTSKYSDPMKVGNDKSPLAKPLIKNISLDRKDPAEIRSIVDDSKKLLSPQDPFRDQISCIDHLPREKSPIPSEVDKVPLSEPLINTVAAAAPIKPPTEEKKSYDSVIHNISNLFNREREERCDLKARKAVPEKEAKLQRKPFDFPLVSISKPKTTESYGSSLQIGNYFSSLSNVKPTLLHSAFKPVSPTEIRRNLAETVAETSSNISCSRPIEVNVQSSSSLVKKEVMSNFDALKLSRLSKKEVAIPTPVVPQPEVKEVSTPTSVIAFASSTASSVPSPVPSDEKKNAVEKTEPPLFEKNANLIKDTVIELAAVENVKVETKITEQSVDKFNFEEKEMVEETPLPEELPSSPLKDIDFGESIHKSLIELSIAEKAKESPEQSSSTNNSSPSGSVCNVFLNVSADKSSQDNKELFSPQKDPEELKEKVNEDKTIPKPPIFTPGANVLSNNPMQAISYSIPGERSDAMLNAIEPESSQTTAFPKKEMKKKKSKSLKKFNIFDSEDKPKEGKLKSKKKTKFDLEDLTRSKDGEMKSKTKKLKKNKNKKRFSKGEDRSSDIFAKADNNEGGLKDMFLDKIKKKEKRKREEKKNSRMELKLDDTAESKGEFSKKDKKKNKKNRDRMNSDKKSDSSDKKIKKKKKVQMENNLDSESDKETPTRLVDKKKKKEKKRIKPKDFSSSDDAHDNRLLIDEGQSSFPPVQEPSEKREKADDPDMSFLLCEEKVPASPVGVSSLPDDTTGSSSVDDNSNNRSPTTDEDRIQAVVLDEAMIRYQRPANMEILDTINKHNAEACAVLENTPPTTPSSSPASIPCSSPSRDREPFIHYTESTQSGRESFEGELDTFHCGLNRVALTESEEYRAAATLAFAVCKSVGEKPIPESCRPPPLKRQKSELDDYSPSKHKKKSKRSFGMSEVSKIGNTRYKAASRSPRGESCDTYDSSNASILTTGSPPHVMADSAHFTSFSHHPSPQMSTASEGSFTSSLKPSKSSFYVSLDEYKDPEKRITILQDKMSEMKKLYASLKAEVATIDRRRKKARKKLRESGASSTPGNNTSNPGEDVQNSS